MDYQIPVRKPELVLIFPKKIIWQSVKLALSADQTAKNNYRMNSLSLPKSEKKTMDHEDDSDTLNITNSRRMKLGELGL